MIKLIVAIAFAVAFLVVLALTYDYSPISSNSSAELWLGMILGVLALITFFYSGSQHFTFASVLSYGHLMLVAAPVIYISGGEDRLRSYLSPASIILYVSVFFAIQLVIFLTSRPKHGFPKMDLSISASLQFVALALVIVALTAFRIGGLASPLATLALASIVLSVLVTVTRSSLGQTVLNGSCLILIISVFGLLIFDGYGRLEMATYLMSIAVIMSWRFNSYIPKIATVVVAVPAYLLLTAQRIDTVQQRYDVVMSEDEALGSVFGPFQSGAYILQQVIDGSLSPAHGQSLITSVFFWIPRAVWPQKPLGFGAAIVPVTQPHKVDAEGHSDAASYFAEFVWDFGLLGFLLIPVLIWLVVAGDRAISRALLTTRADQESSTRGLQVGVLAVVVSMLLNYVWGGSFTFVARAAIPAMVLFGAYLWSSRVERRRQKTASVVDHSELRDLGVASMEL